MSDMRVHVPSWHLEHTFIRTPYCIHRVHNTKIIYLCNIITFINAQSSKCVPAFIHAGFAYRMAHRQLHTFHAHNIYFRTLASDAFDTRCSACAALCFVLPLQTRMHAPCNGILRVCVCVCLIAATAYTHCSWLISLQIGMHHITEYSCVFDKAVCAMRSSSFHCWQISCISVYTLLLTKRQRNLIISLCFHSITKRCIEMAE